ncbi:hypothetical protein F4X73_09945 [Candidatus Poribacteria bacterium]|nr:hypothetical protein [Candidatus Poribacteria bacterium]
MQKSLLLGLVYCVCLIGLTLNISGCGGSNLKNPVSDSDTMDDTGVESDDTQTRDNTDNTGELDVTVTVTQKTVKPGEKVEITASVQGVTGTSVTLNWLNITGYGSLSSDDELSVTWTAPDTLDGDSAKVEVIQLVVTVIRENVSVIDNEIQTETQILSDTIEILLKVVRE